MDRREFLKSGMVSLAGLSALRGLRAQSGRSLSRIGLQLYTVRSLMEGDLSGTIARVAEIGFEEVEFAGYYGRSASEVREVLRQNGLAAPSGHTDLAHLEDRMDATLDYARAVGHDYLVLAYLEEEKRKTLDDYRAVAELLNTAGERCRQAGLQMAYHNHDFEFEAIDGKIPFELLLEETDPKLVQIELDLYWVTKARTNPYKYFRTYPGRFPLFHVKDMENSEEGGFTEVGKGRINFPRIFGQSGRAGVKHYFVEQDQTPGNPLESARISYEYLEKLEF